MKAKNGLFAVVSIVLVSILAIMGCAHGGSEDKSAGNSIQVKGKTYPKTKEVGGKKLVLNNVVGVRYLYQGIPIDLYTLGLYTESPITGKDNIMKSKQVMQLDFQVLDYDLNEEENVEGWKRSFAKSCVENCSSKKEFDEVAEAIGGAKRLTGAWMITVHPDKVDLDIKTNRTLAKTIPSKTLGKNILAVFFTDNTDEGFKKAGTVLAQPK